MPATSGDLEPLACLCGGEDACAHRLDDGARLLDQLCVARVHPAREVQVVLKPDAHVAAEEYRLCHPGHLHAAHGEGGPHALRREVVHHGKQVADVGGHAVGNAGAQLDHRRGGYQTFLDHLLHEPEVAGVEYLELHLDAELAQDAGALTA